MSLEALWTAEFGSNLGWVGAGVVIFETGRIFGGDGAYYYLGKAEVKNDLLEAEIEVTHFAGQPHSIFGSLNNFHLKLSGRFEEPVMELQGHLVANPALAIGVRLTKRAELP